MATREEYNACMRPHITGKGKSKEQRKLDFCIGSKLCSSKAETREEATQLCGNKESKEIKEVSTPTANPCASIIDMTNWVQQPDPRGQCRPCLLAPVTQWYVETLKGGGRDDLVAALEGAIDGGEVALAAKLDEVKTTVSLELRARLREFDCHAQLYKGEEDAD